MTNQQLFSSLQLIDTPLTATDKLAAFGLTNALLDVAATQNTAILHFWTLPPTLILGLKDRHLPALTAALSDVAGRGYDYFIRNSGGLAVVSDGGILNVSLFIPQLTDDHLSVDDGYALMKRVMQQTFPSLTIENYEITHSYCPGDFDLSVDGKKIAGISQRRSPSALVVMAYLSVSGDQPFRGNLVKQFYETGLNDQPNTWGFPDVWPESMINVADALRQPLTLDDVKGAIRNTFEQSDIAIDTTSLTQTMQTPDFQTLYAKELQKMTKRQIGL